MAAEFGLLSSAARVPMSVEPPPLIDPVGATQKAYTLAGKMIETGEAVRQQREGEQDRVALQEYLKAGGDLYTPPGIEKAVSELRGKVSPDTYLKLGEHATKTKQADARYRAALAQEDANSLDAKLNILGAVGPQLESAQAQYAKTFGEKGRVAADQEFEATKARLLPQAEQAFGALPFGKQVLQMLSGVTPESAPMLLRLGGYQEQRLKEARLSAQIRALEGKLPPGTQNFIDPETNSIIANIPGAGMINTDTGQRFSGDATKLRALPTAAGARGAGGQAKVYQKDGTTYRVLPSGQTERLDSTTGEFVPEPTGLPAGATIPGSAPAVKAAETAAGTTVSPLTPEENAQLAEFTRVYGRSLPAPQFGTGAAARNDRILFYRNLLTDMKARGETPTQAGIQAAVARASQESLKRITTQDTVLRSEEGEALKLLDDVEKELVAIGGVASPFLRRKWNEVETELIGDPKFVRLNTLMGTFVDTLGRLSSNATGAAGTPVAYLNFAQKFANKDFNLEQIKAFKPTFQDFVKARRSGVESSLKSLTEKISPPPRREAEPAATAPAGADTDRVKIIRAEYDKAVASLPTITNPEERKRVLEDIRATRSELKKLNVDVPEVTGEAPAPAPATDFKEQATKAFGKYEPEKYDYRISPTTGKLQRKPRSQ